jgi:hypothetical protein
MYKVLKMIFLVVFLLAAAFFANYFGFVSIPWLDVNAVPTYGTDMQHSHDAAEKVFKD